MTKIEEQAMKLKEVAKSLLTENTSKQDADKIASIDKGIDDIIKCSNDNDKAYNDLKNDYIGLIITSGNTAKPTENNVEEVSPLASDEEFKKFAEKFVSKK